MRKIVCLSLALSLLLSLSGCSLLDHFLAQAAPNNPEENVVPGRMVSKIEIDLYPLDSDFHRCYTRQEKMSSVLQMLRGMDTNQQTEQEPDLNGGQSYYTITATYSNGNHQIYYLLGLQYMRKGDEPWCEIDCEKVMELNQFIRDNPSDTENAA